MHHQENTAPAAADGPLPPHVLIFPLPLQGHVNSMLKLAELCCISGLHVTVLLSDYTHGRLLRHAGVKTQFSWYSGFQVATIPDELPEDHPRVGEKTMDIMMSLKVVGESPFRNLMVSTDRLSKKVAETNEDGGVKRRPVTCLIMDGVLSFAAIVSEEMGIPYIYFRTVGACSFCANFSIQDVIDAGEVPFRDFYFSTLMSQNSSNSTFRSTCCTSNQIKQPVDVKCRCGRRVLLCTSWSIENPGRKFFGCSNYKLVDPAICDKGREVCNILLSRIAETRESAKYIQRKHEKLEMEYKKLKWSNEELVKKILFCKLRKKPTMANQ